MLIPLGNDQRGERFTVSDYPDRRARTLVNSVSPGYFETMGISLTRGRDFQRSDAPASPAVVIVSEAFARAYFPGEDALGKTVGGANGEEMIVGVVKNHAYRNRSGAPEPVLYRAFAQIPNMSTQPRPLITHIRTARAAEASLQTIRKALTEFDPNGPAFVTSLRDETRFEITIRQVMSYLLGTIGAVGLLLATIGLYGVMAYVVASRTPEIAIRMALGASGEHLLRSTLARGLRLVLIGVAIGTALGLAATRPLRAMLAGLSPSDPVAFGTVALVLTVVGLLASYLPARRATRVDPMAALRQQ
jgi:predicted permease